MKRLAILPALLLLAHSLTAATTQTWEMNTYDDFLAGKFEGVSLTREGRLQLAPKLETVFSADQQAIWSVARAADGTLYLGTGHRGRVYRVDPSGKSGVLWTATEPEVFALALSREGQLYAATSPNGKVYRIDEDGGATEYFAPGTTYIWSLAFDSDGVLFVGAGDEGKIFRVAKPGEGELYYETGQAHVTALAFDSAGSLLAGTEPNGILYRVAEKDSAFVLYDANLPEIRSLVPMPDGTVYAAALGGSVARQTAAATAASTKSAASAVAHTSVTVSAAQGGVEIKPPAAAKPKPAAAASTPLISYPMVDIPGVEKSALFRIRADNSLEKVWSSTEENAYGLLASERRLVLSTDKKGRIYEVDNRGQVTLLLETGEEEAVRLLETGEGMLVATSNMGKIFRVGSGPAGQGVYEAPVHDAGRVARWGRLSWRTGSTGGAVALQTRSGNSARPDKTWSEWSAELTDNGGSPITSENARYIQWRARFRGDSGATPVLENVRLAYLPQNVAPKVTAVTVSSQAAAQTEQAAPQTAATSAYSITVTDTGETGASTVSGTSTQNLSKAASDNIQVTWQTEDLDGDRLVYSLFFRGVEESEWKLLKDELETASHQIDSDALADGRYYFRVVASDERVNPAGTAREGEKTSVPILVDHTPPALSASGAQRSGASAQVTIEASDAASALVRCEYSIDARPWKPLAPEDGITDSKDERFSVRLEDLEEGERLLVVRAYDSAQNAGLVKVVLR